MLLRKQKAEPEIDLTIDEAFRELRTMNVETKDYARAVKQLDALHKMKAYRPAPSISPEKLLVAGVNLLGIVLILNFERLHVVSSKALGFVLKTHL